MGNCKFCGDNAGWFKDVHDGCIEAVNAGLIEIKRIITSAVAQIAEGRSASPTTQSSIEQLILDKRIPRESANAAIVEGWSTAVTEVSLRAPLPAEKMNCLVSLCEQLGFSQQELSKTDGFRSVNLSMLLCAIVNDVKEIYENALTSRNPFNCKPGEVPIAFFGSVVYSREKTTRSRVGGYGGLSVRIAPGVYSHFGGFKAQPIEKVAMEEVDYGGMLLTTEAIYFGGEHTTFRIAFDHILTFHAREDGIGFSRTTGHGTPEIFSVLMPDRDGNPIPAPAFLGWFLFNATHFLACKNSTGKQLAVRTS